MLALLKRIYRNDLQIESCRKEILFEDSFPYFTFTDKHLSKQRLRVLLPILPLLTSGLKCTVILYCNKDILGRSKHHRESQLNCLFDGISHN